MSFMTFPFFCHLSLCSLISPLLKYMESLISFMQYFFLPYWNASFHLAVTNLLYPSKCMLSLCSSSNSTSRWNLHSCIIPSIDCHLPVMWGFRLVDSIFCWLSPSHGTWVSGLYMVIPSKRLVFSHSSLFCILKLQFR